MKQFLYLNTDIVNSIIAQEKNGLLQKFTRNVEKTNANEESFGIDGNIEFSGNVGLKQLANIEASLNEGLNGEVQLEHQQTIRKIYEKTLHDAAFDIAYNIINPQIVKYQKDNADPGEYIEIKRVFEFIDIEYLGSIFSKDGIVKDLIEQKEKEIEKEVKSNTNREQRRKYAEEIEKAIDTQVNKTKGDFQLVGDALNKLFMILPYSRLLFASDGYIIPVEEKYFRVNPRGMGFIYGGEMKVVGLITNVIGKDTNTDDPNNIFSNIQFGINEIIRGLLPTNDDNLYVVTPIAIYYE